MLLHRSFKLYSIFLILFSFCFSDWVISTPLSSRSLIHSSASSNFLLIPSSVFLISVSIFFCFDCFFFVFYLFVEVPTELLHYFQSLMSIFMTITLNVSSAKLFTCIMFISFSEVFVLFFPLKVIILFPHFA